MRKSVYIETTVVSYLTAKPSRDLLTVAWQRLTIDWWDTQRQRFDMYVSEVVINEARRGDRVAAEQRLHVLTQLPLLAITNESVELARALLDEGILPAKALNDAMHIAVAAVHGLDYLLTWNCRHLDNAELKPLVRSMCAVKGFTCPEICTPQELMGETCDE